MAEQSAKVELKLNNMLVQTKAKIGSNAIIVDFDGNDFAIYTKVCDVQDGVAKHRMPQQQETIEELAEAIYKNIGDTSADRKAVAETECKKVVDFSDIFHTTYTHDGGGELFAVYIPEFDKLPRKLLLGVDGIKGLTRKKRNMLKKLIEQTLEDEQPILTYKHFGMVVDKVCSSFFSPTDVQHHGTKAELMR